MAKMAGLAFVAFVWQCWHRPSVDALPIVIGARWDDGSESVVITTSSIRRVRIIIVRSTYEVHEADD